MTELRAVFCDLDGTLVDTAEANHRAYSAALARFQTPFSRETFALTWGRDSRDFLPEIAPHLSSDQIAQVRLDKAERYRDFLCETTVNMPLVRLLKGIKRQAPIALVTTAKRVSADAVLDATGLADLFDFVVSGDDTERSKPSPDPYIYALALVGVHSSNTLTFEDSEAGALSAAAAGIEVIIVEFGANV